MNFQNSSQSYISPVIQVNARRSVKGLGLLGCFADASLLRPVGKVLLVLLPIVFTINIYVSSSVKTMNESLVALDNRRHELMDANIELRAEKARLRAPEMIRKMAGEKLSLYEASKGQVGKYNRRKGTFTYL